MLMLFGASIFSQEILTINNNKKYFNLDCLCNRLAYYSTGFPHLPAMPFNRYEKGSTALLNIPTTVAVTACPNETDRKPKLCHPSPYYSPERMAPVPSKSVSRAPSTGDKAAVHACVRTPC